MSAVDLAGALPDPEEGGRGTVFSVCERTLKGEEKCFVGGEDCLRGIIRLRRGGAAG